MKSHVIKTPRTGCTQSEGHIGNTMFANHTQIYLAVDSLRGRLIALLLSYQKVSNQNGAGVLVRERKAKSGEV